MVPNGWFKAKFGEITEIGNGQVDPKTEPYSSMMHIGPENVVSHTGQIIKIKSCKESDLISGKYEFDENAIVYSKIRPNLNKVCKPDFKGVCSADMYPIWVKNGLDKDYLFHYMLGPHFYKAAISMSMRTGMPKINRNDLNTLSILLPPIVEQKKISQILSTWDQAISATEKLLENSQQQKKALMQELLTGKKRVVDENGVRFHDEWNQVLVSEICHIGRGRVISKTEIEENKGTFPVYSSQTLHNGVMGYLNSYDFDGEVVTWTTDGVNAGTVFYRTGKFNCTNVCGTLTPKKSSIDLKFLAFSLSRETYKYVSHTLANPKLMNGVMGTISLKIPSFKEQQKIAKIILVADKEIETLQKKLDCLKQEKKALMQQLLTGKKRVKVAA